MAARRLLKETLLALALLSVGLFCLPAMIYFVGQGLVGEYESGLQGLYQALADELAAARPFAWLLVISPYLIWQLARIWFWLHRQRHTVN